jgi:hypothetical protein
MNLLEIKIETERRKPLWLSETSSRTGSKYLLARDISSPKTFFLYNVFRATRYKTTSLPAALNQARRIDTLFAIVFICSV